MNVLGPALALFGASLAPSQPFTVRFAQVTSGREVTLSIDGGPAETEFAGKLGFQDATHSWQSVCADVRSPIVKGQFFQLTAVSAAKTGGNIAYAGNIVAHFFSSARNADQCAGLQLAVWKTIEDGPNWSDFSTGHLRVKASPTIMIFAQQYYQAAGQGGDAVYLQAAGGQSGSGQSGGQAQSGGGQSQLSTGGGGGS
jgi:hypothetical protein